MAWGTRRLTHSVESPQAKGVAFEDRASLIQQASAFADPCTFRLIAKNVTNLLTQREAGLKADANQSLEALLRYGFAAVSVSVK